MSEPTHTERELRWLRRVRDVSQLVANEPRLEALIPLILESAIEITEAERGFWVKVLGRKPDGDAKFRVETALGFNQTQLKGRAGDISRTVVERVLSSEQGLVTTREEDAFVLDASSVQARRVLSIACVPMRLRGTTRGVLYLDHRFRPDAFTEADLPILQTFADQAALALETAELRADQARLSESLRELEQLKAKAVAPPVERRAAPAPLRFGGLVGGSASMCDLYEHVERVARTWDPVLILGESGTGKGTVAREIHARSELPNQPFLAQGCAAFSEEELHALLFGEGKRRGVFERAERGTVVLTEVSDLGPGVQGRLVDLLRNRRWPCRIIATTSRDLRALAEAGSFREDLYYRLDVQRIVVPPLRERRDDLSLLVDQLVAAAGGRMRVEPEAEVAMQRYPWPGNVLELKNEVQRLLGLGQPTIGVQHLSQEVRSGRSPIADDAGFVGKTLGEVEREMVEAALRDSGGNKAQAARRLGVPRSSLYGLLERYGLR